MATLKFDLNEEASEFNDALQATAFRGVLQDIDRYLRNRIKYETLQPEVHEALTAARQELLTSLEEAHIYLWD